MIEILIIMVGVVGCTYILAHADIKIAFTKTFTDETKPHGVTSVELLTQEQADKAYETEVNETYDTVLQQVQEILGGLADGD